MPKTWGVTVGRETIRLKRRSRTFSAVAKGGIVVSIVRVGLAETKNFSEGYEAIFGKKDDKKKTEPAKDGEQTKKEEEKKESK
jgi:hypothetical protein